MLRIKGFLNPFAIVVFMTCFININALAKRPYKDYCLDNLSAKEQSKLFSNIVNLGASFGHGCASCTVNPVMREHNKESGDTSWVRRNFLVQFLKRNHFKKPLEFSFDFISIVENDFRDNFSKIFTNRSLKKKPYRSRWAYYPLEDFVEEMGLNTEINILNDKNFKDNSDLVGGAIIHKNDKLIKNKKLAGHLYQSYPGSFFKDGAKSKSIFDFGIDNATIEDFFINLSNKKLVKKIKKSDWSDPILRSQLREIITNKIKKTNPSMITAIDPLFWDSIPRMLNYAHQKNPKSFFIRFLTSKIVRKIMGTKLESKEFESRKFNDFFQILENLSFDSKTKKAVPVILANLIDRPGKHIHDNQLEEVFGTLIGNYIYVLTGIDFTKEFVKWLKELEYQSKEEQKFVQSKYKIFEQMVVDELGEKPMALLEKEYITTGIGDKVRGKIFKIILTAFGDLPLMIKSIDMAFTSINSKIKNFAKKDDHNVYLLDAKEFYENFHLLVHPKTMHPTVKGAKFMAKMLAEAPCKQIDN